MEQLLMWRFDGSRAWKEKKETSKKAAQHRGRRSAAIAISGAAAVR
jgi:hypothetical protein